MISGVIVAMASGRTGAVAPEKKGFGNMSKKTVAVVFGGQSSEHEVSCISATTIIKNIDTQKYEICLIGITKDGRWLKVDSVEDIESGAWENGSISALISPDAAHNVVLLFLIPVDERAPVPRTPCLRWSYQPESLNHIRIFPKLEV